MTEETARKLDLIHNVAKDVAIWLITAVCAFVGWNNWQVSLSVERLVVEIKHIAENEKGYDKRFEQYGDLLASVRAELKQDGDLVRNDVKIIRDEQISRTKTVYDMADIERRLKAVEANMNSRRNIRWNFPDQQQWIEDTKRLNPDWNPATPRNSTKGGQ